MQLLKDFNFNYLPSNITVGSNYVRQYNEQKFRELNLPAGNIGIPTLYQRNFLFDWQYAINYNLTKSLRLILHLQTIVLLKIILIYLVILIIL